MNKVYPFQIEQTSRREQGAKIEALALGYLQEQGAKLIQQNFRCRLGEIDLIVADQNTLVFVEVRFRKNVAFGTALESINWQKRRKIIATAAFFLKRFPHFRQAPCRFDSLTARLSARELCFEWIQNAFQAF